MEITVIPTFTASTARPTVIPDGPARKASWPKVTAKPPKPLDPARRDAFFNMWEIPGLISCKVTSKDRADSIRASFKSASAFATSSAAAFTSSFRFTSTSAAALRADPKAFSASAIFFASPPSRALFKARSASATFRRDSAPSLSDVLISASASRAFDNADSLSRISATRCECALRTSTSRCSPSISDFITAEVCSPPTMPIISVNSEANDLADTPSNVRGFTALPTHFSNAVTWRDISRVNAFSGGTMSPIASRPRDSTLHWWLVNTGSGFPDKFSARSPGISHPPRSYNRVGR